MIEHSGVAMRLPLGNGSGALGRVSSRKEIPSGYLMIEGETLFTPLP